MVTTIVTATIIIMAMVTATITAMTIRWLTPTPSPPSTTIASGKYPSGAVCGIRRGIPRTPVTPVQKPGFFVSKVTRFGYLQSRNRVSNET
jgi:hypothetical protein